MLGVVFFTIMLPLHLHPRLNKSLRSLKGVGPKLEHALSKKGYQTVGQLLLLMPNKYQDRRALTRLGDIKEGAEVLVKGTITRTDSRWSKKTRRKLFEITVSDESGEIRAYWFRLPVFLRKTLSKGDEVLLFGEVSVYSRQLYILHPEIRTGKNLEPNFEIRPVYPDIEGIKPGNLRRVMTEAIKELDTMPSVFPREWLAENSLIDPIFSIKTLHRPPTDKPGPLPVPKESKAWKNLAFFELLFLKLSQDRTKAGLARNKGFGMKAGFPLAKKYIDGLEFELTGAQDKALKEIFRDMESPIPMNRLLEGDVGSGKTVLANACSLAAAGAGFQAAFMAPTELLARQHYQTMRPHALNLGIEIDILLGGFSETEKKQKLSLLKSGQTRIIFGTHALFSKDVAYNNLGLIIIDEQHRFGVGQRWALKSKARRPDTLIMSATPIPRSLAMTIYGEMDISIIDELPPGRESSQTILFNQEERLKAYKLLADEIAAGGQAFVVLPRIENNNEEENGIPAAEEVYKFLRTEILDPEQVGLVHGRMDRDEQDQVIDFFRTGKLRTLVATTIIEVGLDITSATMILIEGAERFGLAQLHQLRGRVGRGKKKSFCLLLMNNESEEAGSRLKIMTEVSDGFILAEEDLRIRGAGDFTSRRQSGMPWLSFAVLPRNMDILKLASMYSQSIIAHDPELTDPAMRLVKEAVSQVDEVHESELIEVG